MSMTPAYSDYINAVKNPHISFADLQLKSGHPVRHGVRFITSAGSSSLVFKFWTEQEIYAVRCYTRDVSPDMPERYKAISTFLSENPTPFLINLEYQRQGILVDGVWYSICKMPWIEGHRLDEYLDKNYRNSFAVSRLSLQFLELANTLCEIGCAHGNLAHDNILITGEQIKLVGYDSLFVPAFVNNGLSALSSGHKNYQHPQRKLAFFDAHADHFAAIVIYLSLKMIENESSAYNQGAASLAFTKDDYLNPQTSERIKLLKSLGYIDSAINFTHICQSAPQSVPSLSEFIRMDAKLYGDLPGSVRKKIGEPLSTVVLREDSHEKVDSKKLAVKANNVQQPYLFISHSSVDNAFVDQLADELHRLGYRTFVDHRNIVPGVNWMNEVETALHETQAMVLVMSPSSVESPNVEDEWVYYLEEQAAKPIFIALKEPCKRSFRLAKLQYADFHSEAFDTALSRLLDGLHQLLA